MYYRVSKVAKAGDCKRMTAETNVPSFDQRATLTFFGCRPDEIAPYVILAVRDPLGFSLDAAEYIARSLSNARKVGDTGMYVVYSGDFKGTPLTVVSTGTGSPDTELALMEILMHTKVDAVVRVGTSGSLQRHILVGDIVISKACVRSEGASKEYVDVSYPAVADPDLVICLREAAAELGVRFHVGITRSNDSMFCGLGRAAVNGYLQEDHKNIIGYWSKAGVANVEREASVILTLTSLFGVRGGAVCSVVDNYLTGDISLGAGVDNAVSVALLGLHRLHAMLERG